MNPFAAPDPGTTLGGLGRLERDVMEVVWNRGQVNVRDVVEHLPRPLAYTTVMTTLDRLYKKGYLQREKSDRAFVYAASLSRMQWERHHVGEFVSSFFASPRRNREALVSSLLEAVAQYDAGLLEALEGKIRTRRRELDRRGNSEEGQ